MELQIKDLVDSIKKDGVEEAEKQSAALLKEAQKKADEIVENALLKSKKMKEDAEREISILEQSSRSTIKQAARDVTLSLKKELEKKFEILLSDKIKDNLSGEALNSLILAVVKGIDDPGKYEVQINALNDSLKSSLATQMKKGLVIKPVKGVEAGFKLKEKDGSGYFDFSVDEIAAMLKPFLGNLGIQE